MTPEIPSTHVPDLAQRFLGNVVEMNHADAQYAISHLVIEGEKTLKGYQGIRDLVVFTDKRIIFNDKQGISGKKEETTSIPWKSIETFSFKTPGKIDLDADVSIHVRGEMYPRHLKFAREDIGKTIELQKLLAKQILGVPVKTPPKR